MRPYNNTLTRKEVGRERSMVAARKRAAREDERRELAAEREVIADGAYKGNSRAADVSHVGKSIADVAPIGTSWKPKWMRK